MTPEARSYLDAARVELDDAKRIVALPLPRIAARCAYFAMFHAAEAFIAEHTNRSAKTHSGVRSEFSRLLKDVAPHDLFLFRQLAQAYAFKEHSDYPVPGGGTASRQQAETVIEQAEGFIERITTLLTSKI